MTSYRPSWFPLVTLLGLSAAPLMHAQENEKIDFVKDIQPILEYQCITCHNPDSSKSECDLTTRETAMTTGNDTALVPSKPEESLLYLMTTLPADDVDLMPPAENGGPLPKEDQEKLRIWIEQGAEWPEDIVLRARTKLFGDRPPSPDNLELAQKIHDLIVEKTVEKEEGEMNAYTHTVPITQAEYHMVPVPGGTFLMGSPDSEANRNKDEGPQIEVKLDPFWIGKYEVTWDEYEPFMITDVDRYKDGARKVPTEENTLIDAVSMPTPPYTEMSFGMGQDGYPAISMTQHAANKYCQWLSAQTGHFYRLPTEAEWEYACRAGSQTAYSFGDDVDQLDDFGWFYDNSDGKYQKVGTKQPNAWGLYDMHGNVMEWTIDQYDPNYFNRFESKPVINPRVPSQTLYPRTARGGSWDDDPENLRSAARTASSSNWKQRDPQLPKSIWYHTDAQWLGFRIVRPLNIPSAEEMYSYWTNGVAGQE